jgi:phage repressor protein C with HTH and peptisase S24 domain
MSKYERLRKELLTKGRGRLKAFGHSMVPLLKDGSLLTIEKRSDYHVNDIVFCKVHGRYFDAHKVTKKNMSRGWLISNNHGFDNGWTKTIFGKVVMAEKDSKVIYESQETTPRKD